MLKKISIFILAFVILITTASCGNGEPFSDLKKEYESGDKELKIEEYGSNDEFWDVIMHLVSDNADIPIQCFIDITDKSNGVALKEYENFEAEAKAAYEFCYSIIYYDINKVPKEYSKSWESLKAAAEADLALFNYAYDKPVKERTQEEVDTLTNTIQKNIDDIYTNKPDLFVKSGETFGVNGICEITINGTEYKDSYPDLEKGKVEGIKYLVCDYKFKKIHKDEYENGYTLKAVYKDGEEEYEYDDDVDWKIRNGFPSGVIVDPLETAKMVTVIEVPEDAIKNEGYLVFKIGDENFKYKIK